VSQTEAKLSARIEDLPAGSFRRQVLEGARRFKASWVELGRLLSEVRRRGAFREWGFDSFEAYCAKELFIRKQTAEKLTLSYGFLERHEPELARGEGDTPRAPPFEVIEVLSRAEAQGRLPAGGWKELRDEVLERPPGAAALSRQLTEKYGPEERPPPPPPAERLRRLAGAARRVAEGCGAEKGVPRAVAERARDLADELEELAGE
jgi:hypothetical protein